ncbi:MAG: maleylacetoacetate isomerase [Pseudomonadota bacterium]
MKLYTYWRSSAAYRVRIALALKGVSYERVVVSLHPDRLEQYGEAYKAVSPEMRLPSLEVGGKLIGQSMAMLELIEETQKGPSLLPDNPWARAEVRAFAQLIVSDTHPLQNMSVFKALRETFGADEAAIKAWAQTWIGRGLAACEARVSDSETKFLFGNAPGFAEICLVPQLYNARRFEVDVSAMPTLLDAEARCQELDAFKAALPEAQPDAPVAP